MGGERDEDQVQPSQNVWKRIITYLWRSDIVPDAASGYNEINAISEVSWVVVFRRITSAEGPTQ